MRSDSIIGNHRKDLKMPHVCWDVGVPCNLVHEHLLVQFRALFVVPIHIPRSERPRALMKKRK